MTKLAELKLELARERDLNFTLSLALTIGRVSDPAHTKRVDENSRYEWRAVGLQRQDGGHVIGTFIAVGQVGHIVYAGLLDALGKSNVALYEETGAQQAYEYFCARRHVSSLVAGPEFAHVPGCYYRVKLSDGHYASTVRGPRVVGEANAETFGASISAAWAAHQWGGGAKVERVVSE